MLGLSDIAIEPEAELFLTDPLSASQDDGFLYDLDPSE
jgi:hypothetical protein